MAMSGSYLDALASHGATLIKYIGLVDDAGDELSGGTPAYARKQVYWSSPSAGNGTIRPYADSGLSQDLIFNVPAGTTVGGWRGYSAVTGGTDYGGEDLDEESLQTRVSIV